MGKKRSQNDQAETEMAELQQHLNAMDEDRKDLNKVSAKQIELLEEHDYLIEKTKDTEEIFDALEKIEFKLKKERQYKIDNPEEFEGVFDPYYVLRNMQFYNSILRIMRDKIEVIRDSASVDLADYMKESQPLEILWYTGHMIQCSITLLINCNDPDQVKSITIVAFLHTNMQQIKEHACKFWKIPEHKFTQIDSDLRAILGTQAIYSIYVSQQKRISNVIQFFIALKDTRSFEISKDERQTIKNNSNSNNPTIIFKNSIMTETTVRKKFKGLSSNSMMNIYLKMFRKIYSKFEDFIDFDTISEGTKKQGIRFGGTESMNKYRPSGFLNIFACLLILLLNGINLFANDIILMHDIRDNLSDMLMVQRHAENNNVDPNRIYFQDIVSADNFYYWLIAVSQQILPTKFVDDDLQESYIESTFFQNNTIWAGPMRLIKYDTKPSETCNGNDMPSTTCYDINYNENTWESSPIYNIVGGESVQEAWGTFKTKEESHVDHCNPGFFGNSYCGNGYVWDLFIQSDNYSKVEREYLYMKQKKLIDTNTMAINVILGGYIQSYDLFFSVNLFAERTSVGSLNTNQDIEIFKPSENWNRPEGTVLDILYLIPFILVILVYVMNLRRVVIEKGGNIKNISLHILKVRNLFALIFIIFNIISTMYRYSTMIYLSGANIQQFPSEFEYMEYRTLANLYKWQLRFKSLVFGFGLLFLLIVVLEQIFNRAFLKILDQSFLNNIKYIFVLIQFTFTLGMIGSKINGPYESGYSTQKGSILEIMLGQLGTFHSIGVQKYSPIQGFFFFTLLYLWIVFFTFNIFFGNFMYVYYNQMSKVGYCKGNEKKVTIYGNIFVE